MNFRLKELFIVCCMTENELNFNGFLDDFVLKVEKLMAMKHDVIKYNLDKEEEEFVVEYFMKALINK